MASNAAVKDDENYENYGSVDLNDGKGLPPSWRRDAMDNSLIAATIVGHENGKADAYLSDQPRAKHQFSWVGRADREALALRRMTGYVFVTADTWTKNENLWEWEADEKAPDGPRYCVRFDDRLMARPAARYSAEKERRKGLVTDPDSIVNGELAKHDGASAARDSRGQQLRPTARL